MFSKSFSQICLHKQAESLSVASMKYFKNEIHCNCTIMCKYMDKKIHNFCQNITLKYHDGTIKPHSSATAHLKRWTQYPWNHYSKSTPFGISPYSASCICILEATTILSVHCRSYLITVPLLKAKLNGMEIGC